MSISITFAPKLFPHHFGGIGYIWVQPHFRNLDFRFSPRTPPSHKNKPKHQNHQTWLCTKPTKINSFWPKLFPHHFGGICEIWVQQLFPRWAPDDPACWPERWKLPRQRIDVRTASNLRPSSRSTSRTCKGTERRRCGRSHSNAQVSDRITKY